MLNLPTCVCDLQRQSINSPINNKKFSDLKFNLLSAALYSIFWPHHYASNIDNTLILDGRHILKHLFRHGLRFESTSLQGKVILSQHYEATVSLTSGVMNPSPDEDFLPHESLINIRE